MTAFELLAYVAAFILCMSFLTFIICAILMFKERNKAMKEYLKRREGKWK